MLNFSAGQLHAMMGHDVIECANKAHKIADLLHLSNDPKPNSKEAVS